MNKHERAAMEAMTGALNECVLIIAGIDRLLSDPNPIDEVQSCNVRICLERLQYLNAEIEHTHAALDEGFVYIAGPRNGAQKPSDGEVV